VCGGSGKVNKEFSPTFESEKVTCHGCGGLGWVQVNSQIPFEYPIFGEDTNRCPSCGGTREATPGTGCGKFHYGTYSSAQL